MRGGGKQMRPRGGGAAITGDEAAELSGRIRHLRFGGGCGSMTEHRGHEMPGVLR
ncbi:hypothetical protein GZL_06317 [Streptomyces sp. 769]|nr:hypothetical protein GZL_06317 [Streptomyces sp. 769]